MGDAGTLTTDATTLVGGVNEVHALISTTVDAEAFLRASADNVEAVARAAGDAAEAAARIDGDAVEAAARVLADDELDDRIDALIIGAGTSSAEVVDARNAGHTDGTTPTVLSDRLEWGFANAFHPMNYGAVGDGATDDRALLNTLANTTMPAGGGYLVIDRLYKINSDMTFPAKVTLVFHRGGKFVIPTAVTVTILGPILAGHYEIFDCAGTGNISLSGNQPVAEGYPEWWGAHEDADGSAALQKCLDALNARTVRWGCVVEIMNPVTMPNYTHILGNGVQSTSVLRLVAGFAGGTLNYGLGTAIAMKYQYIDGLMFEILNIGSHPDLTVLDLGQTNSGPLETTFFRNISFTATGTCTWARWMRINYGGPVLVENINVDYRSTGTFSILDYPLVLFANNGLTLRNLNYNVASAVKGIYVQAGSFCDLSGIWYEQPLGNNVPCIRLIPRGAVTMRITGCNFHPTFQITAGVRVGIEFDKTGNTSANLVDFELVDVYSKWGTSDIPFRHIDEGGIVRDFDIDWLTKGGLSPVFNGIKRFNRHEMLLEGFPATLNNGRVHRINQQIGPKSATQTFDIPHHKLLRALNDEFKSCTYLLMLGGRKTGSSNTQAPGLFVIGFGYAANIGVTALVGSGDWGVAYNPTLDGLRVTCTNTMTEVCYEVVQLMYSGENFA